MISNRRSVAAAADVGALCDCDSLLRGGGAAESAVRLALVCCGCSCVNADPNSIGKTIAALVGVSSGGANAAAAGAGLADIDAEADPASDDADDAVTAGNRGGEGGGCNVSAPSCRGCVAAACVSCMGVADRERSALLLPADDCTLTVGLRAPESSSLYRLMAGSAERRECSG